MKQGGTLNEVISAVAEIERTKADLIAPKGRIRFTADGGELLVGDERRYTVRDRAHAQIAEEVGIPPAYYRRLRDAAPDLLAANVNRWLQEDGATRRMVRTIGGEARAFLSERYRPLDNFDLVEAVLPVLGGKDDLRVESVALTEDRLFIKVLSPRLTGEVRVGDVVQAGLCISNSETGMGSIRIEPFMYQLVCKNGAIRSDARLRKYHIGGRGDAGGAVRFYSSATRAASDKAFFMKVADTVRGAFQEAFFREGLEEMKAAAGLPLVGEPLAIVEQLPDTTGGERGKILEAFLRGNDSTVYGLAAAVTFAAQGGELSYERATELERLGGAILARTVRIQ